jgi:hypothetical protein
MSNCEHNGTRLLSQKKNESAIRELVRHMVEARRLELLARQPRAVADGRKKR